MLAYVLKTVWQAVSLLLALPLLSSLSHILVQTPPGVPTLPVLWLYTAFKGTRLVVDFHNYSHTILALATGSDHLLVSLTRYLEGLAARRASSAFCVTQAMAKDLRDNWGITATVLYDRPPQQFSPLSPSSRSSFLSLLSSSLPALLPLLKEQGSIPGLIVSSTSWTEDEDFGVLLSALVMYEERLEQESGAELDLKIPELVCVITGKGPQKQFYLNKIMELELQHVSFVTPWLETSDYPLMLASADLGVCLHTSSSGLDLPMKVVDMFGCGLPVAAIDFPALGELVRDGENGRVFRDSGELLEVLVSWFRGFPDQPQPQHLQFRKNLEHFRELGWSKNWNQVALPIFQSSPLKQDGSILSSLLLLLSCLLLSSLLLSLLPTVL